LRNAAFLKNALLALGVVSMALLAAFLLLRALPEPDHARNVERSGTPEIGGPFTLTAHTGEKVSNAAFAGDWRLIYFGYTYCPDVCPAELAKMSRALEIVEERGYPLKDVQPLFISVDPVRDTPERLASYLDAFHPKLIGLTGTIPEIETVADAFAVHFRKAPGGDDEAYLMDHTSMIFLMTQDGVFEDVFTSRESAQDIAAALASRLD